MLSRFCESMIARGPKNMLAQRRESMAPGRRNDEFRMTNQ
jgi:hypothetical protein